MTTMNAESNKSPTAKIATRRSMNRSLSAANILDVRKIAVLIFLLLIN